MIKNLTYIELSGEKFPIKLDNLILQHIQETYGSIQNFELLLMGWEKQIITSDEGKEIETVVRTKEPSIAIANNLLPKLVLEGFAVEGKETDYKEIDIVRLIDQDYMAIANIIHEELKKALSVKKPEPSQTAMTQRKLTETTTTKNGRLTLIGCIISALKFWASQRTK